MNPLVLWSVSFFIVVGLWFSLAEGKDNQGAAFVAVGMWILTIDYTIWAL
jgi:hypothetical protein